MLATREHVINGRLRESIATTEALRSLAPTIMLLNARTLLVSAATMVRRPLATMSAKDELTATITSLVAEQTAVGQSKDAAAIDAFFTKYFKPDCDVIRPSGNPMPIAMFKGMMGSADITIESDEVTSIDDIKEFAGGNAAVVVYTCRSKFSYKGTPNDDIAKFSATMEKVDGTWKMVHNHRGTGQAPE